MAANFLKMESVSVARLTSFNRESCHKRTSSSSVVDSVLHGFELLLLKRIQNDSTVLDVWYEKLKNKHEDHNFNIGDVAHDLWYLTVTLDRKKDRFLQFLIQNHQSKCNTPLYGSNDILMSYLHSHAFTELHLDGIFKYGDHNRLPSEVFTCSNVKYMSMKYNYLEKLSPDIGRMKNLEYLALTNNKLSNKSIPHTLAFCTKLHTLLLDNNLLVALPGFLLQMTNLKTVHRHGNNNYFKSTFMLYHTGVNERILVQSWEVTSYPPMQPESLQYWAARALISSGRNFFADPEVPPNLKSFISESCTLFNVCGHCGKASPTNTAGGYLVVTFKNPYLGNSCVPFQHVACSLDCAHAIEGPARQEQMRAVEALDRQYEQYVAQWSSNPQPQTQTGRFRRKTTFRRNTSRSKAAASKEEPDSDDSSDSNSDFIVGHARRRRKKKQSRKNCVIS